MTDNVVTRFFTAGEADDVPGAVACFADDGVWITWDGPEPGTTYRRDEIPGLLAGMIDTRKKFENQGVRIVYGEQLVAGDKIVLEYTLKSPDGSVLDRGVDIFTLRDGKIAVKDVFRKA
ncbi:nuclear transport factor 2 family protein [Streptomyces sp. NPDC002018]|uniref:nuclear transport factor 2 family protein n=1 Tax=Streptomyces sp. NPDC002018 TaxID=3364629 RepID=UPI0036A36652